MFPLLCQINKFTRSFGEYILREGDIPKGMYIVLQGQIAVYIESIGNRSIQKLPFSKNEPNNLFEEEPNPGEKKKGDILRGFNNSILKINNEVRNPNNKVLYHNLVFLLNKKFIDSIWEFE